MGVILKQLNDQNCAKYLPEFRMAIIILSDESESEPDHETQISMLDPLFSLKQSGVISNNNVLHLLPIVYSDPEIVRVISNGPGDWFNDTFDKFSSTFRSGTPLEISVNSIRFLDYILLDELAFEELLLQYTIEHREYMDEISSSIELKYRYYSTGVEEGDISDISY